VVVTEVATGVTKLIPGAFNPSWSPDGTQLAYLRGAATHVFVEAVAGGAPRDVGPGAVVSWAPDGSRLFVFAANDLHEVELRSGARRPVVRGPESLIVSPDGRWVAFTRRAGNAGFFIAEVAGGAERRLAPTASDFTWSPDSRRIAFSQSSPERQQRFSVAAIDSPSVVDVAPAATAPVWSPDASRVAFLVQASAGHVVQVATPGEPPKPVARGENPRWSRDGKQLLVDDRNGRIAITRVVSVDAGSEAILRDVRAEQWLPGSDRVLVRLSPNDSYEAGEIAVADADLTRLAPVTHTVRAPAWTGVEVRDAARGRLRWRFATAGDPAAVALDGNRVAVLLSNGKKRRIEVRRSGTAGPIRSPAVSTDVTGLSLSGHWLVYLGRGAVRAVDIRSGRETLVARPLGTVIGLSVEGTRVAWGEQRRGRPDVILALDLPG
jgi:dipeptidyl aminopeptidase/acylaminoacyl peptidase